MCVCVWGGGGGGSALRPLRPDFHASVYSLQGTTANQWADPRVLNPPFTTTVLPSLCHLLAYFLLSFFSLSLHSTSCSYTCYVLHLPFSAALVASSVSPCFTWQLPQSCFFPYYLLRVSLFLYLHLLFYYWFYEFITCLCTQCFIISVSWSLLIFIIIIIYYCYCYYYYCYYYRFRKILSYLMILF